MQMGRLRFRVRGGGWCRQEEEARFLLMVFDLYSLQSSVLTCIARSPDDAKIKQKMVFAASKDALRRSLVGIATEIQGTDESEVAHEIGA